MRDRERSTLFDQVVRPNLRAAFNLARWLVGNDQDAEDVAQDAALRAFRFIESYRGGDARTWVLAIARNCCYTWIKERKSGEWVPLEDVYTEPSTTNDPVQALLLEADRQSVDQAIESLPVEFREVLVLREMDDLSYKEVSRITGLPIGTVMSRLARARRKVAEFLKVQDCEVNRDL